ncbi:DUF937 domain-containing protein [Breoghania sp.]|uniref:DUF937 domain-containing protein n=1 Tax=Breoghania sp. TaxID=2065378 RepID=UPI002633A631|nr:DUF937 domain-containing protein [Breoghania sp.]MDJ0930128.1 DUF937 domain-containing protein [Breoghania sp.]
MTDTFFPLDLFALVSETQKRFGLGEENVRRATEALMPAFWAGLRRNTFAPEGIAGLMQAFGPAMFAPPASIRGRLQPAGPPQIRSRAIR